MWKRKKFSTLYFIAEQDQGSQKTQRWLKDLTRFITEEWKRMKMDYPLPNIQVGTNYKRTILIVAKMIRI